MIVIGIFVMALIAVFLIGIINKLWKVILFQKKDVIELNREKNIYAHWIHLKQTGFCFQEYLKRNHYNRIAISGINDMTYLLLDELSDSDICVKYVFGEKKNFVYSGYTVANYSGIENEKLDLVIFTDYKQYQNHKEKYIKRFQCGAVKVDEFILNIGEGGIYNEPIPLWRKEYGN